MLTSPLEVIETSRFTTIWVASIATDPLATDVLVAVMAPTWTRQERSLAGFHFVVRRPIFCRGSSGAGEERGATPGAATRS